MRLVYFVTHTDVTIDPDVPVPDWSLSKRGLDRMLGLLRQPWISSITSLYSSTERKALEGAAVLAEHLELKIHQVVELGENDRSSTGFLPPQEFERVADQFFACPRESIRGWETAEAAQKRIVLAVDKIIKLDGSKGSIVIMSHGAVGTLSLCHLANQPIARQHDQPGSGGGNFYAFELESRRLLHPWKPIEMIH